MPTQCEQLKQEYEELKTLGVEFDNVVDEAVRSGNTENARKLKAQIIDKRTRLEDKINPLYEKIPNLKEQYETQVTAMRELGILIKLESGEEGIKAEDGIGYPIPKYTDIMKRMYENREILKEKAGQGFVRLQLTPFALSIQRLKEIYGNEILKHYEAGTLRATNGDTLELSESEPVCTWSKYDKDVASYYPKEFSENHGGITKQEAIKKMKGWRVTLTEDMPDIPREGKGKTIGGRAQIETNKTASEYLTLQNTPQYQGETGLTPEDWLAYATLHLRETNTVIDDYRGNGSLCYLTGMYLPSLDSVPVGYWFRGDFRGYGSHHAMLGGDGPANFDPSSGYRTLVDM